MNTIDNIFSVDIGMYPEYFLQLTSEPEQEVIPIIVREERWENKPIQILRGRLKNKTSKLGYYEKLEVLYQEGEFEQLCCSLKMEVNILSSFLYRKIKGYGYTYSDCQSEVWLVVAKMIDEFDTETELPYVYRLHHKVNGNLFPNIVRDCMRNKRKINHINVTSIEQMAEEGEQVPDRKAHLYFDAIIEKFDKEARNKKFLESQDFTEQEKAILKVWETQPDISGRRLGDTLGIPHTSVVRMVKKLKKKIGGINNENGL